MSSDFTYAYAALIKADKHSDGTLTVYGKATDDSIDMDQQICDPTWLDTAMPEWFKSGGNIREQHSNIAAGVAKEYEAKSDGHYISALVVDPVSVKKVEAGVLKGFSIGIKSPRVVRDQKAANGRIIDGQIIEVSLVDRPANPNAKLIMAKSIEGESSLVQVEELHEYKAPLPSDIAKYNENHDEHGRFSEGDGGGSSGGSSSSGGGRDNGKVSSAKEANQKTLDKLYEHQTSITSNPNAPEDLKLDVPQVVEDASGHIQESNSWLDRASSATDTTSHADYVSRAADHLNEASRITESGPSKTLENISSSLRSQSDALNAYASSLSGKGKSLKAQKGSKMETIKQITELAKSLTPDTVKFDQKLFDTAIKAIADLIVVEAKEISADNSERDSIENLLDALKHLRHWYEGEVEEGEVIAPELNTIELGADADVAKNGCDHEDSCADCGCDGCKACKGCDSKMCKGCSYAMAEKSATTDKCLDCGCHKPAESHGRADVSTAEMVAPTDTPKSAEVDEVVEAPAETPADEVKDSEAESSEDKSLETLVEEAVKSAMESVKSEIDALRAEKESAVEKSVTLEAELATALTKSVAGGPKRTAIITGAQSNEYLVKAATYKAKADATTDPVLAKGYKALYAEFSAKGGLPVDGENE